MGAQREPGAQDRLATDVEIAQRLLRAARRAAESDDPDTAALGAAIGAWLRRPSDPDETLEQAIGLRPYWRKTARRQRRDPALRRLALERFPMLERRPLAKAIAGAITEYLGRAWVSDRAVGAPALERDAPLFDVVSAGDRPPSLATIRRATGST